jgi:hypothetical protein
MEEGASTSGSCLSPILNMDTPGFGSSVADAVETAFRFPKRRDARRMNCEMSA